MPLVAGRCQYRFFCAVAALGLFPFVFTIPGFAQGSAPVQPEPQQGNGFNPLITYSGIKDNINLANGDLSFCIPLVSLPGPQMPPGLPPFDLDIPLCYNSNFLTTGSGGEGPILSWFPWTWAANTPPMGPGWTLTGRPGLFDQSGTSSTGYPLLTMPDGSTNSFEGWSGPQNSPGWQQDAQGANVFMTYYDSTGSPLYLGNGFTVAPTCASGPSCTGANIYNEVETDTQGDTIAFTANSATDSVGRTVTVNAGTSSMSFTYPDPTASGQTQTVTVQFENVAFTCSNTPSGGYGISAADGNYLMPTAVILPNGLQYAFQYDSCGLLRQINYPDGGYTRYSYTDVMLNVIAGSDMGYPYYVNEVAQKAVCPVPVSVTQYTEDQCPVPEQVTTYEPTSGGYSNQQNAVIDPVGNKTVYQFDPPYLYGGGMTPPVETSRQLYDASGHLLRTVTTTYLTDSGQADSACVNAAYSDLPSLPTTQITTLDNGVESETMWKYNCNMVILGPTQMMQRQEYDFGATSGTIGPLLRTTAYTWANLDFPGEFGSPTTPYPNAKHIFDRQTSVVVSDGNNRTLSKTLYSYDPNGVLVSTQKWRNTDSSMQTTTWGPLNGGVGYTYPNGTEVVYSYANNYAGGENPSANAYPTTITTIANGVSSVQQRQYYYGGGLVAASCGNNYSGSCKVGKSSVPDYVQYTYDLLGRETSATGGDGG